MHAPWHACRLRKQAASAPSAASAKESLTNSAPAEETTAAPAAPEAEASVSAEEASVQPEPPAVTVKLPLCQPGEIELDVYMARSGFLPMVIPDVATNGLNGNRGVQCMEEATASI